MSRFKITFHPYPKDRTWLERQARKFFLPNVRLFAPIGYWDKRDKRLKAKYPIRFFLTDILPGHYRRQVRHIKDVWHWILVRTVERHHVLKLRNATPGYRDTDVKMLAFNFELLVNYVEVELPAFNVANKKRDPNAGIKYLNEVIDDETVGSGFYSLHDKELAAKTLDLYMWWTEYRNARINPYDHELIWRDVEHGRETDIFQLIASMSSTMTPNQIAYQKASNWAHELDNFYENEDQERLEELIKIRKTLWT